MFKLTTDDAEGQTLEITQTLDELAREGARRMIAAALEASPTARAFFEGLATFYRKGYLRWIDGARRPETRVSRIREMVGLLDAGKKQR